MPDIGGQLDGFGASFKAGGNIAPSRFVVGGAADETVVQSGANGIVIGISHQGDHTPPGGPGSDSLAASSGENVMVYGPPSICMLELGGTVARFELIKSDANGKGVTAGISGAAATNVGARALESGVSGDKIRVMVFLQHTP